MLPAPIVASRARTRRTLLAVGIPLSLLLIVLGGTSWRIAGRPSGNSQGLVGQMQMLLGVFQGVLGLCIALSTIYYAGRTGEMVESMHYTATTGERSSLRQAVDRLAEASIAASTECSLLATLMKPDWRWQLPWKAAPRNTLLSQIFPRVINHVAEVVKSAETLKALAPASDQAATELAVAVERAFEAAVAGETHRFSAHGNRIREATLTLRERAGVHVPHDR